MRNQYFCFLLFYLRTEEAGEEFGWGGGDVELLEELVEVQLTD